MKTLRYYALSIIIFFYFINILSSEESVDVYYESITKNVNSEGLNFTIEDQKYLYERAKFAYRSTPDIILSSVDNIENFRKSKQHDEIKNQLNSFIDNKNAWPEYIYIAKLTKDKKQFLYVVSSSDVIESHKLISYETSVGMCKALEKNKSVVTDFSIDPPAAYIPIRENKEITGFFVFVKNSWQGAARRINPVGQKIDVSNQVLEDRISVIEKRLAKIEKDIEKLSSKKESDGIRNIYDSSINDNNLIKLSYGKGEMHTYKSLGGSGHVIYYEAPEKDLYLKYIEIFGSRYGEAEAPNEDFNVYILNEKKESILSLKYPYSNFKREVRRWVALPVSEKIPLPQKFWVVVEFNPHQTKGVYVGVEYTQDEKIHSKCGTIKSFLARDEEGEWMIRAYLSK